MAENRIRIEVDYDKAVAKVEDLRIKFEDLGTKVTATRNRIQKAVLGATDAIDGSVKALMREKGAWQEVQSSLSTTNAQYRVYQAQIDKIDAQIAKLTDTRKREEIALKNSAAGIQQQIALIKEEQANRKLSNTQYRVMQEEIDKLQAKYNSLTNTIRSGTIASFDAEIAKLREEQRTIATSREEIERYEQDIEKLRIRKRALTGETKQLDKAAQSFSSSAGGAGATVTEFGRTIGDLPFGLMGITNNLQQLSQQFVDLQAKSGGFSAAMQSIKSTLMGPAGFVVLINIATSALLYFTRQKEKANKKAEEFNDSMLLEIDTFKNLTVLYDNANDSLGKRRELMEALAAADADYSKALAELGNNEEARQKLSEEYLSIRNRINEAEKARATAAETNKDNLDKEVLTNEKRIELQKEEEELLASLRRYHDENSYRRLIEVQTRLKDDAKIVEANNEIVKSTIEIADAQEELNLLLESSSYDKAIQNLEEYREELRLLRNFTEGPERIAEEIRVLKEKLSEEAIKAGTTETATYQELLLQLLKKEEEFYQASVEKRKEASDKEKERLDALSEINQEYLDNLEAQYDESGIIRLTQQERDAIAEAKALGASRGELIKIEQYYANERQKVLDEIQEKADEKKAKADEKKKKEDEKKADEAAKNNKKKLEDFLQGEIDAMKAKVDLMSEVFSNFGNVLDELGNISQSRFERQIGQLNEQRDLIRTNDALTKEEKEQQLTELQRRENELQRDRIKAEYRMFAVTQTLTLAEMAMKERAAFRERQLMKQKFIEEQKMAQISLVMKAVNEGQMTAMEASSAITSINLTAAEEMGEATMSIGTYMKQLGPLGIAAFALSIGGVIASIVSAKRKAGAEIAGLSDAPISVGSGGGAAAAPASPAFNVVGASAQNQLAAAIAGQQAEPVKAYVVSSDVSSAQELDRKIVEGASI